jgi:hypothetical protein
MKGDTSLRQLTLLGAALTLLLGFGVAQAQNTYTVNTTCDDYGDNSCGEGSLTLRDAINDANNDAAEGNATDTINFIVSGTITLGSTLYIGGTDTLTLTIDGSAGSITISGGNSVQVISIYNAVVTLNALTIANGYAPNCDGDCSGGGGAIFDSSGGYSETPYPLTITNSTFSNNAAPGGNGGAIFSYQPVSITNSTFYENSAAGGGAIFIYLPTLTVTNSTFVGNTSPSPGSAIAVYEGGTATLKNTILAAELPVGTANNGNCAPAPVEGYSPFTDGGGNLSDDPNNTCNFGDTDSGFGVPDTGTEGLNLATTLANNQGPTETIALLSNSVAISSVAIVTNCPATDQRGVSRPSSGPLEGTCSSGAFQFVTFQSGMTSASGTVAGCTTPAFCNLSGGDTQTIVPGTRTAAEELAALTGSAAVITENLCIISQDPRALCGAMSSTPHYTRNTTFPVSEFCPGFGNTVVPDYLCGAYSSGGPAVPPVAPNNGLAVLEGIGNGVNGIAGLLWLNDADPDAYFDFSPSGAYASECNSMGLPINPVTGSPDGISVGWAPWSGSAVEGSIPEGPRATEVTDGCGGQKNPSSGVSVTLIGVTLNLDNAIQELGPSAAHNSAMVNLAEFAEFKYANLFVETAEDNITLSNKARLLAIITQSALFLAAGNHACAETTLYDADAYVTANASVFLGNSVDPNSYGRTRMRLLNLFYTLYTRLDMQTNPITNNPLLVGSPLLTAPTFSPPYCSKPHL